MTRTEHLDWCKKRAIEYVDNGDLTNAYASMVSDLGKHDETRDHMAITMGMQMMVGGLLGTVDEMKKFILGFN